MEPMYTPRAGRPPSSGWKRRLLRTCLALILLVSALGIWGYYAWPNRTLVLPDWGGLERPVLYKGQLFEQSATGTGESLKLPFTFLKGSIDPTMRYEEATQSIIMTTSDKVVRLKTSQLTAMVNEKPFELRTAVEKVQGVVTVPLEPLKDLYALDIQEPSDTGAVIVRRAGDTIQWAKAGRAGDKPEKTRALRQGPSVKSPVYANVLSGESLMIWGEEEGWYRVQLSSGIVGYMKKEDAVLDRVETIPLPEKKKPFVPWKPIGGKINLTWQQVASRNPDVTKIGDMPGLNVISPQWFHLEDGEGTLKNMADAGVVKWAHDRGYQVWALFSNGFEPKQTSEALATYDKRMKMIMQLVSYAQMYGIQGINVDFENVYLKDKENMVQFMRELAPLLHEQGLVVSIDVTVKDGSETYSLFLDREAIGQVVDYMMVMTYDEHWATSPTAGSVASLPWVEKGIDKIMKEDGVPASKLLLGVPYYTRIWTEQTVDGKRKVTSKAVSMETIQKLIEEKKLKPELQSETGQDYVQYTEDDKTIKIWIENAASMKRRAELVKKFDLAGIASWSRGFETPDIWPVIRDTMTKLP
ncbi:hypothetical protein J31TS4_44090 [Paenibacillus sp. J31TS4]|uniref:glycosyl hydrolase family 18 protein n=1 Tax=Paenibacillus sp. J31TS4 TaxID=2807195 RepID=UPI001B232BA9|nr:glycosyl hydrolase family 18 protein [Paenibacillus sp. J31TS4]GIP41129.1 hypothetical protein J31TS4_44090 [Paenibacillus sp. J31TS4]